MFTGLMNIRNRITSGIPSTFILSDTNGVYYWVFVDANGALVTQSGAGGTITNVKFTGGSNTEAALKVSTSGELTVDNSPSAGEYLNNNFLIRAMTGSLVFKLGVNSSDQLTTTEVTL